ncbi:hypothetical protein MKZ38_001910 [Zalerion maritima]|uniref:Uncharacterized protein n=1 Tax=Zalerion maritima TaxID=339359 RepID=A0AAD5RX46_9PEZI|nr:hypothetical protein MKZ38_001910 [Zalerion maritima]
MALSSSKGTTLSGVERRGRTLLATSTALVLWPSTTRASVFSHRQNEDDEDEDDEDGDDGEDEDEDDEDKNPSTKSAPRGRPDIQGANNRAKELKQKQEQKQSTTALGDVPSGVGQTTRTSGTNHQTVVQTLMNISKIGRPTEAPEIPTPILASTSTISLELPTFTSGGSFTTLTPTPKTKPISSASLLNPDISSGTLPAAEISPSLSTGTLAPETGMAGSENDGGTSNRTLVITLSTVLSVVGFLLIVGGALLFWRNRKRRIPLFSRGITPIDDDEIETWKTGRTGAEKHAILPTHQGEVTTTPTSAEPSPATKGKKPPSVIVYTNNPSRVSGEGSPRSLRSMHSSHFRNQSIDVPQTPVLAKAPNARPGLCDEALPGADPFVAPLRRQPSRLAKMPPTPGSRHIRSRSSRSSVRSFGYAIGGSTPPDSNREWLSGYHTDGGVGSTPRTSADHFNSSPYTQYRIYSSNSIPPRLSLGDEMLGGLSPPPVVLRNDIGRAIG